MPRSILSSNNCRISKATNPTHYALAQMLICEDTLAEKATGMTWNVSGDLRGKRRKVRIELTEYRPDNLLKFFVKSSGIEAFATMESMALTRKQSRIKVTTVLKPKTISARLILQSAKLAKNSMNRKFNHRFWTYANYIENNYNKSR